MKRISTLTYLRSRWNFSSKKLTPWKIKQVFNFLTFIYVNWKRDLRNNKCIGQLNIHASSLSCKLQLIKSAVLFIRNTQGIQCKVTNLLQMRITSSDSYRIHVSLNSIWREKEKHLVQFRSLQTSSFWDENSQIVPIWTQGCRIPRSFMYNSDPSIQCKSTQPLPFSFLDFWLKSKQWDCYKFTKKLIQIFW